jgi:uroporphyrinogen-III synthase
MKPKLLILRPEPGNSATAARAAGRGWETVQAPLFTVAAIEWAAPEPALFDAVMLTSANAARLGGAGLAGFLKIPLYAVGGATADAARVAGFVDVREGASNAEALIAQAAADGVSSVLHLAGREHRAVSRAGMTIERRVVYGADPVDALPDAARTTDAIALLHSPRAAALFAGMVDPAAIRIAAISPATLAAAGTGWRAAIAAASPDDDALLAAAARLCE